MLRGLFKLRDAARRGAIEIPEMMLKPMSASTVTMPGGGRTFHSGGGRHRGFRNISPRGAGVAPTPAYTPHATPSYGSGYETVTMPGGSRASAPPPPSRSALNKVLAKRVTGRGEGALKSVIYSRKLHEQHPSWGVDFLSPYLNNRYVSPTGSAIGGEAWGDVVSSQREVAKNIKFSGGKGSYKNPTTGGRLPGRSAAYAPPPAAPKPAPGAAPKPWDPSQRGQMVHVPRPSPTPPINKVASTNSPIGPSGSVWGAVGTGLVGGGLTANFFSSEENRGFGTFVKGGLFGLGGGLGMHMAMGSKIMSGTTGAIARAAKKGGNETAISWAEGAHRAAVMAQSQQSRAAAWSAGALLAGGMGGSSRSKAHGINANRGNRFGG